MIQKYKNKPSTKKIVIFLVPVFLIVLLVILESFNLINIVKKNSGNITVVDKKNSSEQPANIEYDPPKAEDSLTSPEKNNTPKLDEPSTDPSAEISVLITRASRSSVGVFIEKISAGTCELTITQSGVEKISMTADVLQERDYSTCKGFDFDSSKLDSTPIVIKVTVTSENRTGTATQEVE